MPNMRLAIGVGRTVMQGKDFISGLRCLPCIEFIKASQLNNKEKQKQTSQ